ncbi:T9SS type A sorting domain-containing protein [Saprospiraceae bacterium]|jgi:polyhydroxybutyrate depolymerase|nr:T9SS type A sorting domain-containing protein [Saprospiraceae bacterium]MDA9332804.1 T9SS type A sorting domain-containing protein [Saprospiraceae bacterium]MDA9625815.1 T9SS type A sorting domain-containing protein [bacterium]
MKHNFRIITTKGLISVLILITSINVSFAQGYISETIEYDGLTREYSIYVPESYDGTTSFPLLFNFHGGGGNIAFHIAIADMSPIADTANFIVIYPQARPDPSDGNSFNWIPKVPGTFDDVPFISSLIDTIASNYQIDQNRIYACGYSLGGDMSFELACKLNNKIAAIAPVARTMQANPDSFCFPVHPTGILSILGTDDTTSPYNGLTYLGIEYYLSAAATHSYWATLNLCNPNATMNTVSPSVERYTWSTESGCAYVEELKVIGGGHDWPGSFGNMTIDASEEIWQFVSRYDINGLIDCTALSINENNGQAENYKVFPNPFNQELNIEVKFPQGNNYRIYNGIGELVISGKLNSQINTIDLSSLPPNVYLLKVESQSIKLIKTE